MNGVRLDVSSNEIGIQLYTADFLNARLANGECRFGKHAGYCLMPDTYPDALTHVGYFIFKLIMENFRQAENLVLFIIFT